MASVMGRSCSYSVHLRACLPSASFSSTSSHSLASLSRLASCFFLRFSSASCRTRRLKLCAASSSSSRSPSFFVRCQAEQEGGNSTGSASRLRQLSTMKRASSCETEVEAGEEIYVSSVEGVSPVAVTSRKRATRRKNAVDGSPLQQASDDRLVASDMSETSKRTSSRKKTNTRTSDSSGMDTPAALAKSPQRKKQSTSADVEGKVELGSAELGGSVELAASVDYTSSSTSSQPSGTLKKSTRKKKALTPVLSEKETMSAASNFQEKEESKRKSSNETDKDDVTIDTAVRRSRKKVSSSLSPEEMSAVAEIVTIYEKQAEVSMSASSELDERAIAMPSRRRKQSTKRQTAAESLVNELLVSLSKASPIGKLTLESEPTPPPFKEGEEVRQKVLKVEDGAAQISIRSGSSKKTLTNNIQKRKAETKETLPSPGSAGSVNVIMEKLIAKCTSKAVGTFSQDTIQEPSLPQEVRKVENSVDKASQWAEWNKSNTSGAAEAAVRRHETSYRKQFAMTDRRERHSQQGYVLANMERARGWEKKNRKEFSVRNVVANQASTCSYMQIFGTGFDTGDTVVTVLLFFDRRRFLFNVGEGLHRFCMEHKFKLSKIDHVFLTRVCSETVGGLPGLILTLAAMGETGLTVKTWGPSSLDNLAQAMRLFVPSGWMEHTHSFGPGANDHALSKSSSSPVLLLEDELIKISAVLLYSKDTVEYSADKKNGSMLSTVYICELSTVRGKFDRDKALAKGLRPGYKYGKLQRGESVLSDDKTIMVHPEDVLGPSSPGPIMFVVDCPSTSYVSSLTSSTSLQSFFSETGKVVNCMVHIGPTSVTSSEKYQTWMENFKQTHHIMAQREVKVLGIPILTSSATTLSKLNLVCPWLFPIVEIDGKDEKEPASGLTVTGENLLKYRLRPLSDLGLDSSEVPEAFDRATAQETWTKLSPELIKARDMADQVWKRWSEAKSAKSSWEDSGNKGSQGLPPCLHQVSRKEMELVFLGTGSSQPSKHRNVTGIYIHLFEKGGMLMDCGEGTFAQLKRRYGAKGADDVLLGLKCIWISHMHADHFSGILRILTARRELLQTHSTSEPILVIGPKKLKFFLESYGEIEDLVMEYLDCSQTTLEVGRWADSGNAEGRVPQKKEGLINESTSSRNGMQHIWRQPGYHIQQGIDIKGRKKLRRVLDSLGLKDLYSVPVIHCPQAFAVVLESQERKISENVTKPGWKLVYSGDTRPCQALVEAAHKATILIHEATFEDELIAEAVQKNHSITTEAIKVGVDAGVYRIILTHFSQRYPAIPSFDNLFSDRTCMAFDMMSVNLADLPVVPGFLPALQMLFKDQSDAEGEAEGALAMSV